MIVPLTPDIMAEFYPEIAYSVRGYAEIDDAILGICGVYYADNTQVAFARFSDRLKRKKRSLLRLAYTTINLCGPLTFAVCDNEIPKADNFLKHMGFQPYRGDVWVRLQH